MCLYSVVFVIVIITSFNIICSMCFKHIDTGLPCGEGANAGICMIVNECDVAWKLVLESRYNPYQRCGFADDQITEITCCPNITNGPPLNTERISETTPTERPIINRDGSGYRKSEAACIEYNLETSPAIRTLITGGQDARLGEFPHMAQIGYDSLDFRGLIVWNCGGSLIHPRFILTAAHCIETTIGGPPKQVRLGFVDSTLSGDAIVVEHEVKYNMTHPDYNRVNKSNDIGIIELVNEVVRTNNIYPACLYQSNDDPEDLTATGWGNTAIEYGEEEYKDILQKVDIAAYDLENCIEVNAKLNKTITTRHICRLTPNTTRDTCQGDSGGPLQKVLSTSNNLYTIVGITSHGGSCGGGKFPGIYVRVYSYLDWIESIVWP